MTVVERKLVANGQNAKVEECKVIEVECDDMQIDGDNDVNMNDDDVDMSGMQSLNQNQARYQHSSAVGVVQMSLSLKWIDLKHNRGITNDGIDRLNLIFVRKIQPTPDFAVCVNGCSYEPNPQWELALL